MTGDKTIQIHIETKIETKPILYGKAPDSNLQDYALTADTYEDGTGNIKDNYSRNETKIIIEKQDKETKQKLQGVEFQLLDENKNVLYTNLQTGSDGRIKIENINFTKTPAKGTIETYMPNSVEGRLFTNEAEYLVDGSLEYKSAEESNPQTLEIGANGGYAVIRFSNSGLGSYSSDDDDEIIHDGSLLEKIEVSNEDVQFDVSFDLVITVDGINYRGTLTLNLPCGNIIEEGTSSLEMTDLSSVVFKRE